MKKNKEITNFETDIEWDETWLPFRESSGEFIKVQRSSKTLTVGNCIGKMLRYKEGGEWKYKYPLMYGGRLFDSDDDAISFVGSQVNALNKCLDNHEHN